LNHTENIIKIQKTGREVNLLQKKIQRVIPTGISAHQEIFIGIQTEIEVEPGEKTYFVLKIGDPLATLMF